MQEIPFFCGICHRKVGGRMDYIIDAMSLPLDNLLGMLLYAILCMGVMGFVTWITLRFIPYPISVGLKNSIIGISVYLGLIIWWFAFIS